VTAARTPGGKGFKTLRVTVLLLILAFVGFNTWFERYRSTRWRTPLFVAIYPIAADASPDTADYVAGIDAERYAPIDRFFAREGARYRIATAEPVRTRRHAALTQLPPQRASDSGLLGTIAWSLRLRYWAWRVSRGSAEPQDIRVFVLYHDPRLSPTVPHSLGLSKGLIGVVYAFADHRMDGANDVVIAHEMLHTLGASDKYAAGNDAPLFPDGYGDPAQLPLYPQATAELMAGRRMLNSNRWEEPESLDEVVVGAASAAQIRWR
jgi:hypothetical protein